MSDNGLILTDVIKKQVSTDPKSIAKSKNPAFINQSSGAKEITVEDNSVLSTTEEHNDNSITVSGTINSENRVYLNSEQNELENGFDGTSFADGVYETEVMFFPDKNDEKLDNIDISKVNAKVRCSCPHYRFYYSGADKKANFLSGGDFPGYTRKTDNKRPPANQNNNVGMCKHLIYFISHLLDTNNKELKITDSSGTWKSVVSGTSVDLAKPKQSYKKYTKKKPSNSIRVNNLISFNSAKLSKSTAVAKPSDGIEDKSEASKAWENYLDDAYRKLRRYDLYANKYGNDIELDPRELKKDNIDGYTDGVKTLGDLRKLWASEYDKRVEEYLLNKYKNQDEVDAALKRSREKLKKDPNYRYIIPTKLTRRTRGGSEELERGREIKTASKRGVKRQAGFRNYLTALNYIKDKAKKQNKTPAEVKNELLPKAKAKNMKLSQYVLSLIDRQTKIDSNKNNPLQNKKTKVAKRAVKSTEEKVKDALKRKNSLRMKLVLDSRLKQSDNGKLDAGERHKIEKEIDQLDKYLQSNYNPEWFGGKSYVPDHAVSAISKSTTVVKTNNTKRDNKTGIPKPSVPTKSKVQKKSDTTTVVKKPKDKVEKPKPIKKPEEPKKAEEPVKKTFDPETYDFEAKRDKNTGRIIVPEKPSNSSEDETKYFYLKSIKAKIDELKMFSKNIENGRIKASEEVKKGINKSLDNLSNDLISGCMDFDINFKDI